MFKLNFKESWYKYKNPQIKKFSDTSFYLKKKYLIVDNHDNGEISFEQIEEKKTQSCDWWIPQQTNEIEKHFSLESFI